MDRGGFGVRVVLSSALSVGVILGNKRDFLIGSKVQFGDNLGESNL